MGHGVVLKYEAPKLTPMGFPCGVMLSSPSCIIDNLDDCRRSTTDDARYEDIVLIVDIAGTAALPHLYHHDNCSEFEAVISQIDNRLNIKLSDVLDAIVFQQL